MATTIAAQLAQRDAFSKEALAPQTKPVEEVQVEALVILKIIKHCREVLPGVASGQCVGLDVNGKMEITNVFPMPRNAEDADDYQLEMMKSLREVNIDHNSVGWYQSAQLGAYVSQQLIETQFAYQQDIPNSVCIIYDAAKTAAHGNLALKAIRLTKGFMDLYKQMKFTTEAMAAAHVSHSNIFEELPITIRNAHYINGILWELDPMMNDNKQSQWHFEALDLVSEPILEKNLEMAIDSLEEYYQDMGKYGYYMRNMARYKTQLSQYLQKRKQENATRVASGLAPLPEEETPNLGIKAPNEPPRLDSLLIMKQTETFCRQMNAFAALKLGKLYAIDGIRQ